MFIKFQDRIKKQVAKNSFIFESTTEDNCNSIDMAKINGRFPDQGMAINNVCQETYFVIEGSGKIFIEDRIVDLQKNDTFVIKSGKKYSVVGDNLIIVCSNVPSWYPEQFKIIT